MSNFKIVTPESSVNYVADSSFGASSISDSWTVTGPASPSAARITADQWVGARAAQIDLDGGASAQISQDVTASATDYTLSAMIKRTGSGVVSSTQTQALFGSSALDWDSLTAHNQAWYLGVKTASFSASTSASFGIIAKEDGLIVDAVQLEAKAYRTTYIDGTLIGNTASGYAWTGAAHSSAASRAANERTGGRVKDIVDDLGVKNVHIAGAGFAPPDHKFTEYALLDGALYQRTRTPTRFIDLTLSFSGSSIAALQANRLLFQDAIDLDIVSPPQPFKLWYVQGAETLEVDCYYAGGLDIGQFTGLNEPNTGVRLTCNDPFWTNIKENTTTLTENASATITYNGRAFGYPVVRIEGTGAIDSLVNSTTSQTITFDGLNVVPGEVVTIDLRPGKKKITSDVRGNLIDSVAESSNFATWKIQKGDNTVTVNASSDVFLAAENGDLLITEDDDNLIVETSGTLDLDSITFSYSERHKSYDGVAA